MITEQIFSICFGVIMIQKRMLSMAKTLLDYRHDRGYILFLVSKKGTLKNALV
jgi:hypothetical protein